MRKIISILGIIVIVLFIAGCIKSVPLTEDQQIYVGAWTAPDGTALTISADGKCNYDDGSTTFTGAPVTITESMITIKLMGIKKELPLNEEAIEMGALYKMILDGKTFIRE